MDLSAMISGRTMTQMLVTSHTVEAYVETVIPQNRTFQLFE